MCWRQTTWGARTTAALRRVGGWRLSFDRIPLRYGKEGWGWWSLCLALTSLGLRLRINVWAEGADAVQGGAGSSGQAAGTPAGSPRTEEGLMSCRSKGKVSFVFTHQQPTPKRCGTPAVKVLLPLGKLMQCLFWAFKERTGSLQHRAAAHTTCALSSGRCSHWDGIAVPGCRSPIVVSGGELFSGLRCPLLQTLTTLPDFTWLVKHSVMSPYSLFITVLREKRGKSKKAWAFC